MTFAGREADALRITRGKRDRRFNAYNHVIEPLTNTIAPTLSSTTQSSLVHTLHTLGTTRPLAPTCLGFPVTLSTCTTLPSSSPWLELKSRGAPRPIPVSLRYSVLQEAGAWL